MFKTRLRERREALNFSQKDLADKIFVSQQAIGAYEVGIRQPNSDILTALADALECSTDYLLGRTDEH